MKSYVFPGNIEDSILQIGGKPFPYIDYNFRYKNEM